MGSTPGMGGASFYDASSAPMARSPRGDSPSAGGGLVPQSEMAGTERQHLPAIRLAAIDWQATFAAVIIKASADCQAQWWRRVYAGLLCQSSLTCTLRNLIVPAPCCKAIGPSSNIPLRSFAVSLSSSITVMSRPLTVIS